MGIQMNKENEDLLIDKMMHPTSHPYDKLFLDTMNTLHEVLYSKLSKGYEGKDFFSLADVYNCTSEVRAMIDAGNQKGLERSPKGCILSIREDWCFDKPINQDIKEDVAMWMGHLYNYFQWKYNIPSVEIAKAFPAKELFSRFHEFEKEDLSKVCECLYREYFEQDKKASFELCIKPEAFDYEKEGEEIE